MAGASVIGALRVVLGADTAALDKGLKDSQSGLASFGNFTKGVLEGVASSVAGFATGVVASIKTTIDAADKMNKLSQSAGVSVEELSKLSYAADLADVSSEALGKSLGKLSKAMVSAATDGASQAGRAFAAMGVEVKNQDGTLRSSSDVIADVSEKFSGYKDGAEKTALAVALFGKAGAAMIPLLNQGRDSLKDSGDELERWGGVLDKKTTMAAEAFNDNLKKMDYIKQGLWTTITAKLLPSFELFSEQLLNAKNNSNFTTQAAEGISTAIKFMVGEVMHASTWVGNLTAELKAFWAVMVAPDWTTLKTAWADWGTVAENSKRNIENLNGSLKALWGTKKEGEAAGASAADWVMEGLAIKGLNREVTAYGEAWKRAAPIVGEAAAAEKNALQTFLASQAKRTAAQLAEAETIGLSAGAMERLKIAKQADEILDQNKIARTPAVMASIAAAGDAAAAAALKIQAAQIQQQVMSPAEKYAQDLANLKTVYESTSMTMETFQARQQQIAEAAGATWGQAGASIAGSFKDISNAFGKESKGMAVAAKVFGVIQGTISMFTGAAKALELPFPANLAAMATVLAQGASLVASIKSQSIPAAAMGGAFRVPGGVGGGDKVLAQMALEPGELVEVTSNRSDGYKSGGRGGQSSSGGTYTLNVPDFLRPFAEALMPHIEAANRDGHTLKLVTA